MSLTAYTKSWQGKQPQNYSQSFTVNSNSPIVTSSAYFRRGSLALRARQTAGIN